MFDMIDTALSYGIALIVCSFIQESFSLKESSLHEIEMQILRFYLVRQCHSKCRLEHLVNYHIMVVHCMNFS